MNRAAQVLDKEFYSCHALFRAQGGAFKNDIVSLYGNILVPEMVQNVRDRILCNRDYSSDDNYRYRLMCLGLFKEWVLHDNLFKKIGGRNERS